MPHATVTPTQSVSPDYLHRMTSIAKLSAGMVALMLDDIDGHPQHRADALAWAAESEDAAMSMTSCCQALANLNAYLNHYGLDAAPMDRDHSHSAEDNTVAFIASSPLAATDAKGWQNALAGWCSPDCDPAERAAIGSQLVAIVDHQVQACYAHMRGQSPAGPANQARRGISASQDTPGVMVLDDMPGSTEGPGL